MYAIRSYYVDAYLDIVPFVKSHHERYDGLGYPSGLSSTQIPLEARIICVADAFDAMTKVRPYRSPRITSYNVCYTKLLRANAQR